jgi:hypothetical protein
MTVVTMSRKELTRLRVLIDAADGRLSVGNAAGLNAGPLRHRPGMGRA